MEIWKDTMTERKLLLFILGIGLLAWLPTLNFWFFKAYEATWLMSVAPHTLLNLIRGHSFLYFLDLKIFGWNPAGWYATALVLHLIGGIIFYYLIKQLSKNIKIAFLAALIFIANSAYIDVIAWGSFNSYYPLLLIFMLLAVTLFHKYLLKGGKITYLLVCLFVFLGFFVRETGLVIVPLLTVFDILFTFLLGKDRPKKIKPFKNHLPLIKAIIVRQLPFYALVFFFALIRNWYGGISGDYADRSVKWRVKLVKDGLYLELIWAMILTSGKLITAQLIPYSIANMLRELVSKVFLYSLVNVYFFPMLGIGIYGILIFFTYKIRKNLTYFFLMIFSLVWIAAFSLFVSLAVPSDSIGLAEPYAWITMRYRYFAFVGMSTIYGVLLFVLFQKIKNRFKISALFVKTFIIVIALLNVGFIWYLENGIYKTAFEPNKKFYFKFNNEFPALSKNPTFYLYPHTSGLNDYMLEWYFIDGVKHFSASYQVESQIEAVITKLAKKNITLDNTFFLDYDSKSGLINKTKVARSAILNQKAYDLGFRKNPQSMNHFEVKIENGPPVEIPYDLGLSISSNYVFSVGEKPDSERFRVLADYVIERERYLDAVKLKTSITMAQRENEPFYHVLPSNLVDGNIGPRSSWIVNDGVTRITADLGNMQSISAVAWGSMAGSSRNPYSYVFEISDDGNNWRTVKSVKENQDSNRIDKFDSPIGARFVRMDIKTTSGGDFAQVDEFEVIGEMGGKALNYYASRNDLLSDSYSMFDYMSSQADMEYAINRGLEHLYARLEWETNLSNVVAHEQFWYFAYPINISQEIKVPFREAEIFAGPGQFLEKRTTQISVDFGKVPFELSISSAKLIPRYNLDNAKNNNLD